MGRPKKETNIYVSVGEQLKARRLALGLSQKKLAELMNVHSNNIIEYEKGRRGMSLDTLVKYCKVLKLEVELRAVGDEQ